MCSCLELNSCCGSWSQLEKAQKTAFFSFNLDYVTGNRSENGTCPGGGGTPHIKVAGMLVVSLRGVNFGFWSHLGCSGQNAIII